MLRSSNDGRLGPSMRCDNVGAYVTCRSCSCWAGPRLCASIARTGSCGTAAAEPVAKRSPCRGSFQSPVSGQEFADRGLVGVGMGVNPLSSCRSALVLVSVALCASRSKSLSIGTCARLSSVLGHMRKSIAWIIVVSFGLVVLYVTPWVFLYRIANVNESDMVFVVASSGVSVEKVRIKDCKLWFSAEGKYDNFALWADVFYRRFNVTWDCYFSRTASKSELISRLHQSGKINNGVYVVSYRWGILSFHKWHWYGPDEKVSFSINTIKS
jgi:hypothetical protein